MKKLFISIIFIGLIISCGKNDDVGGGNGNDPGGGTGNNPGVGNGFQKLMTKAEFEVLFPYRADLTLAQTGPEFYSYQSLVDAVNTLSNIKIEIIKRKNDEGGLIDYTYKLIRTDLQTHKSLELIVGSDYNESWNISRPEVLAGTVHFSSFLNSGDVHKDKKELSAFLANISHETTGGDINDPVKEKGLYFKQEVGCESGGCTGYTDLTNTQFPPAPNKTYHGRGPIQLSWNYNYGPASFIIYGDKDVLLREPEKVLENATNAFMTAVSFWNMPAGAKPSCHEVIHTDRGFAKTINVINGGLECGPGNQAKDPQVLDRIEFYKQYMGILGLTVSETDAELSCRDMNSMK